MYFINIVKFYKKITKLFFFFNDRNAMKVITEKMQAKC